MALAGCRPEPLPNGGLQRLPDKPVTRASLKDSRWVVQRIDNVPTLPTTRITVEFAEGGLGGYDGCNWYGGSYAAPDALAITEIMGTAIGCAEPVRKQSRQLSKAFSELHTGRRKGTNLLLLDRSGQVRLVLAPLPDRGEQAGNLANTQWRLIGTNGRPVANAPVFLQFGQSTFLLAVGCGGNPPAR